MKKIYWLIVAACLLRAVLAFLVWHPDINNHVDWGIRFWQYGPAKFYTANVWSFTWPNQPPGTIYMFAGIRKLFEGIFAIFWWINIKIPAFPSEIITYFESNLYPVLLKLPAILCDFGIGLLIYKLVKKITGKEKLAVLGILVWSFNPAVWFNSAVWGQYDSVINFLALLSFYFLIEKKIIAAVFVFALSLYTKASLLTFAPIFLIVMLRQKYQFREIVKSVIFSLLIIGVLTLPFSRGEPFGWLFNLYKDKVFAHQLQVITANGFNIWAAITGISEQPQTLPFLGLTYQYWSYILFSIFYIPCFWLVYKKRDIKSIIWSLAVAAFSSFMLLTNMHERYLYPLFPYFTILLVTQMGLVWNYTIISIINLLNLYNFWWIPVVPGLMQLMSAGDRLAPRVLGGVGFALFILFYLRFLMYNFSKRANEKNN